MKWSGSISLTLATVAALFGVPGTPNAQAQEKKPNILVIMGDDVDWFNVGAYHRGGPPSILRYVPLLEATALSDQNVRALS
jgi:hypothetical protein